MPAHAAAQLEHVGGGARLAPGFREIALERQRTRLHRGPRLHLQQPAVTEGQGAHRLVRQREVPIEPRRLLTAHAKDASALGVWAKVKEAGPRAAATAAPARWSTSRRVTPMAGTLADSGRGRQRLLAARGRRRD